MNTVASKEKSFIGKSIQRREDHRLLTGEGQYLDDMKFQNLHHVAFFRSPHAHAEIKDINIEYANQLDGVKAIFTGEDLYKANVDCLPLMSQVYSGVKERENPEVKPQFQRALAYERVRHVGEAIAAVVASSRAVAEDALDLIEVEYEKLNVVVDPKNALDKSSPLLFEEWGDNSAVSYTVQAGNVNQAIKNADYVLKESFKVNRQSGNPIETRGVLVNWDYRLNSLSMWSSTQMPHRLQKFISDCLHLPENQIHVIVPDVGGGFGPKALIYPEEIAMAYMAQTLKIPMKWVEDRLEHMMSTAHSRDQLHEIEVGVGRDGMILGLRDKFLLDTGAYNLYGINTSYNTASHLPGPYRIPSYECEAKVVATNKVPCSQYRGAGRPEAVYIMDRVIDLIARELNEDPAEIRYKNLIHAEEMPYDTGRLYKDGQPMIYDTGDYQDCFRKALEEIKYSEYKKLQPEYWHQGRYIGLGLSSYIEGTGQGPHEGCQIIIDSYGDIVCMLSTASQGQGHETTWAQICADHLGVNMDQVRVISGDTNIVQYGSGTYGSRSAVVGGSAISLAAKRVSDKAKKMASHLLKVSEQDLEIENGRVFVGEIPDRGYSYGELAQWLQPNKIPYGMDIEPGLKAEEYFLPETTTYSNGVHAAIVEVDIETGFFDILNYVVVHDAGKIINPVIADGQTLGGVAQGIGGTIYEEIVYDEKGQLLTGTYMDYLLPTASEIPNISSTHMESPSPRNPLGVKGLGESGAISPPACLSNAVEDALQPFQIKLNKLPLSPQYIWEMIHQREKN
ncbi:xanthine dehydrogenase family protein molybdopterin-binding subunit [Salicibibacter cibarius]|uniref:Xanthine dehydrogenase family protein molybdopterin-binding subunit n=1 Tax=Salicibibacter cibarius TaxID=2743000 RepID=A0A7T6Z1U5_9BACI|nr:xanthine dehydrogenase family protein molybdopterin-binding subunit [Salicibibacter cibarius]QQK74741.1 xanthine dehydrogenase family protein molybdopterin-binding subunit [Salicibibacter cibarius]